MAHSNPAVRAYDPAFAFELSTIIKQGIVEMCEQDGDVIYYLAVYNENYPMPANRRIVKKAFSRDCTNFAMLQRRWTRCSLDWIWTNHAPSIGCR